MASTESPKGLPAPQPGTPCPCGSGRLYERCCGPLISGERLPATAEVLMRSRFTAHVADDAAYLHRTYAATAHLPMSPEADGDPIQWTKLIVHSHELGKTPNDAFVEFSAFFVDESGEHVIQEKSEFMKQPSGQWLYTRAVRSGPAPFKTSAPKAGRNDPCPCGSGKKYKHCCLGKA